MTRIAPHTALLMSLAGGGCEGAADDETSGPEPTTGSSGTTPSGLPAANVVAVTATGGPGEYTLLVSVRSEETGCDLYADWWEVVDPGGNLLYRRILDHSHPTEQPFARDGGPVTVLPDDLFIVRAHLHDATGQAAGYGAGLQGSVAGGFGPADLPPGFAAELEGAEPQPTECLF